MGKSGMNGLSLRAASWPLEFGQRRAPAETPSGSSSSQGLSEGSDGEPTTLPPPRPRGVAVAHAGALTHPCEQIHPAACPTRGEGEPCPLRDLPREWCVLCLQGRLHEDCLGVPPPTHPCERFWGFCRFGDGCAYKDFPAVWCLRCLKQTPHHVCDGIKPEVFQEYGRAIQTFMLPGEGPLPMPFGAYLAERLPSGVDSAPSHPLDYPVLFAEPAQPTYSARKAARTGQPPQAPKAGPGKYPRPDGGVGLLPRERVDNDSFQGLLAHDGYPLTPGPEVYPDARAFVWPYADTAPTFESALSGARLDPREGDPPVACDALPNDPWAPALIEYRYGGATLGTRRASERPGDGYAPTPNPSPPLPTEGRCGPQLQEASPLKWGEEEEEKDVIGKKVQGILNRITPEKFDVLSGQLLSLLGPYLADPSEPAIAICEEVSIKIFEKAVVEPQNSGMYADLIHALHSHQQRLTRQRRPEDRLATEHFIRTLILNRCHQQFYSRPDESAEAGYDRHRKRSQGNARLVAEVYLRKLLPVAIIEEILQCLLVEPPGGVPLADQVEVLCTLLSVAGPQLDFARPTLADCWARVEAMATATGTGPRIRFLLQDLMELRASAWTPRRAALEVPKKLADVQRNYSSTLPVNIPKPGLVY